MQSLVVKTGSAGGTYTVNSDPYNSVRSPYTEFWNTGNGSNTFYVNGTSDPLYLYGANGFQSVNVGNGSTAGINGLVDVYNGASGYSYLYVNNSSSTTSQTVDMYNGDITGIAPAGILYGTNASGSFYGGVNYLSVVGGSAASTYNVHDTSAFYYYTILDTGTAGDTVNVLGTTGTFDDYNTGGLDYTEVGNANSMSAVNGLVDVYGSGETYLYLYDSADTTSRTVDMYNGEVDGLSAGRILYVPTSTTTGGVNYLYVGGGNAGGTFNVHDTSSMYYYTYLVTGTGNDVVNVLGTTGFLYDYNTGGNDDTYVGSAGLTSGINGGLYVYGSGSTYLFLNDSADTNPETVDFYGNGVTGLSPASISWIATSSATGGVTYLNFTAGSGNDTITIHDTSPFYYDTFVNTGTGNDTVNILGTTGAFYLDNGGGNDTVVIGSAAPSVSGGVVSAINGSITIYGDAGTMALTVDDSGDTNGGTATLSIYSLTGLAPAPIDFFPTVTSLTINGGSGGTVFDVTGTYTGVATTINTGTGGGAVNIGDASDPLSYIQGPLTINAQSNNPLSISDVDQTGAFAYILGANSFGGSSIATITFSNISTLGLALGSGNGSVTVTALPPIPVTITGGGGGDTLVGPNTANTWLITGANTGSLSNIAFSAISGLTGGASSDTFKFSDGATLSGALDGGAGTGTNTIDESAYSTSISANETTNTITGVGATFANINALLGGTAANSLTGPAAGSTFNITGTNVGNISGVASFSKFGSLVGGAGNDTFKFGQSAVLTGSVDGGAGYNTLDYSAFTTQVSLNLGAMTSSRITSPFANIGKVIGGTSTLNNIQGPNTPSTFTIGGANAGNAAGVDFANFGSLFGGSNNDTFAFVPGGSLTGQINGGGGTNTIDESAMTTAVTATPSSSTITNVGTTFSNVTKLIGGSTAASTLNGPSSSSTFNITAPNAGTLGSTTFLNFGNLVGGAGNDVFKFNAGTSVSGSINGGGGTNTIDQSAVTAATFATPSLGLITGVGTTYSNVTILIGGTAANSTLNGASTASTFNITGVNSGTLGSTTFSNYKSLNGGTGNDVFKFSVGASLGGSINGAAGVNTIDESAFTTPVTVNLTTNGITAVGTSFANIQTVTPGSAANSLTGPAAASTFNITGSNAGNVAGLSFTKIGTLIGGAGNDTFKFTSASLLSDTIKGGGGTNTLDYSALTTQVNINMATALASRLTNAYSAIQNVIGSSFAGNQLTGPTASSIYNVTGANAGNVGGLTFSGFARLIAGNGNDTFKFSNAATLSSSIEGGSGTNALDFSAYTTPVVANYGASTITGIGGTYANIRSITGGTASNTLTGPTAASSYSITGTNTGIVGPLTFAKFGTINGGAANDSFVFGSTAVITNTINGSGGTNTFDYSAFTTQVSLNLATGTSSRVANPFSNIQTVIGGTFTGNQVVGPAADTTFNVTGANAGNVNGLTFSNFGRLIGGGGNDSFVMSNGASLANGIDGGLGMNWIDYSAFTTPVSVNLSTGAATGIGTTLANIRNAKGGSGNDTLTGNSLGNILIGGAGNDTINGGSGRSVLIGGTGVDTITGGSGDDIVIGGSTSYDGNFTAIDSILNEWLSTTDSYATRISLLKNGGGLNGTNTLALGTTVIDDMAANILTGGAGNDWFFEGTNDAITDLGAGEQVN